MNINQYADRLKYKSLPADFNHQGGAEYRSSWEYTKTFSNYHFDKWKEEQEGEWYHKLGRFVGDWSDDVAKIVDKAKDLSWDQSTSMGKRPGFPGGVSPMKAQEQADRKAHGLEHIDQTNLVLEDYLDQFPKIKSMIDYWQLENVSYRAHVQLPGQCFGLHIDKLWHRCPTNPARIVRLILCLEDYEPGQILLYGNSTVTQWRAGDIHMFDTLNVPHATVNLSTKARPNITITGLRTAATDELLMSANKESLYNVPME
jgi:hypothetical protein